MLFGIELGIFVSYVSHFYIREPLNKHTTKIMEGLYIERYREIILGFSISFIGVFIFISCMYLNALLNFKPSNAQNKNWVAQILANCPVSDQLSELIFQDAVFTEFGFIFYIMGCYYGLVIDAKEYRGTVRSVNQTTITKTALRLSLSTIPIGLIFLLPVLLIASRSMVLPILLIKYSVPSFLIGFVLYGYSKQIFQKFNLVNNEETSIVLEKGMNMGRFEE